MTNDNIFFLTCNEGRDQSMTAEPELRDVFTLSAQDKTPLFLITYTSDGDAGLDGMQVKRLTDLDAFNLPFILDGIDLGYKVYERLMVMLGEQEAEFFADLFVDESGNIAYMPITFTQGQLA